MANFAELRETLVLLTKLTSWLYLISEETSIDLLLILTTKLKVFVRHVLTHARYRSMENDPGLDKNTL